MAHIIELAQHTDHRGSLTVLEKVLPFAIKRVYWMTNLNPTESRGKHRHLVTTQALVCLQGACDIMIKKQNQTQKFTLNQSNQVLILEPEDWHELNNFQHNPVLLLLASHDYMPEDYQKEPL